MRENIARVIVGTTVVMVLALALLFAAQHNRTLDDPRRKDGGRPAVEHAGDRDHAPGRAVYAAQNCASCHSIGGRGNPRYPLDGVGSRRTTAELREYVTATGAAATALSGAVVRRKARYQELPEEELRALIEYLASGPER